MSELSAADTGVLVAAFEADHVGTDRDPPRLAVVWLTPGMLNHAARLASVHSLRAYDAAQLAAGCAVDAALPDGVRSRRTTRLSTRPRWPKVSPCIRADGRRPGQPARRRRRGTGRDGTQSAGAA